MRPRRSIEWQVQVLGGLAMAMLMVMVMVDWSEARHRRSTLLRYWYSHFAVLLLCYWYYHFAVLPLRYWYSHFAVLLLHCWYFRFAWLVMHYRRYRFAVLLSKRYCSSSNFMIYSIFGLPSNSQDTLCTAARRIVGGSFRISLLPRRPLS